MSRSRILVPIVGIAASVALTPFLGAVALAADSTVIVQPGDTLTGISKRQGVSIRQLVELNGIADPNRIYVGQQLRVGVESTTPAAPTAAAEPVAAPAAQPTTHVVRSGENLTWLARRYGVTVGAIVAANGISNPSRIYAGQRLAIPGSAPAAASSPSTPAAAPAPAAEQPAPTPPKTHVVRSGENLTRIARRYGVTVGAIVAANGISNASRIYAGQRLAIPGTTAAPTTSAPAMPASMAALVAKRGAVRQIIVEEAARFGVPAGFALAVAWQESGWQQGVVSHVGAVGVMQLMPATAAWVNEAMLDAPVDMRDTRGNVRAGVRLLKHYLDRYAGNRDKVLAAYYQGQWATDHHGIYAVSRPYIASIKVLEAIFGR